MSHRVFAILDDPDVWFDEIAMRLRVAGVTSPELADALADRIAHVDTVRVARILATLFHFPSPDAVPLLCSMLVSSVGWHLPEDVAELLGEARDPRAIDPLVHIIEAPPENDFNGFLAEKVVTALSRFDDARARAAIARAAHSQQPRTWQATIAPSLEQPSPETLLLLGRRIATENPEAPRADEVFDYLARLDTSEAWQIVGLASRCENTELARHAQDLLTQAKRE